MRVTKARIQGFRGLKDIELEFNVTTVLVGENNSGKTSVLDALRLCLRELRPRGRVVFDAFDFHLKDGAAEPQSADPIQIEIRFSEESEGEWDDALIGRLNRQKILQVGGDKLNHVVLRVTCAYDPKNRDFAQGWAFLNLDGKPLTVVSETALGTLQHEVAFYYLSALRDAARHFDAKGQFWRPFLKDSQLTEDKKAEVEKKLREINEMVVASHTSFEQAIERLGRVQDVVPMAGGDMVSIEAVPGRMFDMLAKAQVYLGASTGARIPVGRHGEGTQSLSVLMLFSAFLSTRPDGSPLVALEEPEAHLHPSAVRALWDILSLIGGQKVISTHSGDLLSEVDVLDVRRLAKGEDGIRALRVSPTLLSAEETRKFNYHIRRSRGELLFARCWLLVEGETESWIYPAAARALGMKLHRDGVRVVEFTQSGIEIMVKVAESLGIPWYCVADDDPEGRNYVDKAKAVVGGSHGEDRVALPYISPEVHLLKNGYESIYRRYLSTASLERMVNRPGDPDYWTEYADLVSKRRGAKTRAAAEVAFEMEAKGEAGVTGEIREVLEKAVSLAGGE